MSSFRAKSSGYPRQGVLRFALFTLLAVAAPAYGQGVESVTPFERPNGALLRAGTLTYELSLLKPNGVVTLLGTRTVTVSESQLGGVPSWLIVEARAGTVVPTLDSVLVNRADMAAERWVATIGPSQLAVSFTRDSAYGALQNYQGRSSFATAVPGNLLLSASHGERVLEMLPLREGYRAAASMLVVGGPTPVVLPCELVVEREEDADVNGRRVRAWRVALRSGAIEARYWVSREGTRVLRTEQAVAEGMMIGVLLGER